MGCFVGKPLLNSLQHLSPALDGVLSLPRLDGLTHEDDYADIRAANQRAQDGDGGGLHPGAWKKLDRLDCSAPTLYVLGFRCLIQLLGLDRCSEHALHYVADALRENPIPCLKVSLLLGDGLRGLDGLCNSPEVAGILTHLTLQLVYPGTSGDEAEQVVNRKGRRAAPMHPLSGTSVLSYFVVNMTAHRLKYPARQDDIRSPAPAQAHVPPGRVPVGHFRHRVPGDDGLRRIHGLCPWVGLRLRRDFGVACPLAPVPTVCVPHDT